MGKSAGTAKVQAVTAGKKPFICTVTVKGTSQKKLSEKEAFEKLKTYV